VSAGYHKDAAGVVHLQGYVLTSGSPDQNKEIFFLPEGYRPTDAGRAFAVRACQDNQAAYVDVLPNGAVTTGTACASLDGVSFHP
jgi:hypothetical protein